MSSVEKCYLSRLHTNESSVLVANVCTYLVAVPMLCAGSEDVVEVEAVAESSAGV